MPGIERSNGESKGFLHPKAVETILAVAIALIAFLGLQIWDEIGDISKDNRDFREKVLSEYVQKRDYQIDINRLYDQLTLINKKLDRMAEKESK